MELKGLVSFLSFSIIQPENGLLISWDAVFLLFVLLLKSSCCYIPQTSLILAEMVITDVIHIVNIHT